MKTLPSTRYQRVAATATGKTANVRLPMARNWKNSSVLSGRAMSNEVSFTIAMISLPVGGTITRMACGRTMRRIALPRLMPRACAASS